jgi:hypothetical protein
MHSTHNGSQGAGPHAKGTGAHWGAFTFEIGLAGAQFPDTHAAGPGTREAGAYTGSDAGSGARPMGEGLTTTRMNLSVDFARAWLNGTRNSRQTNIMKDLLVIGPFLPARTNWHRYKYLSRSDVKQKITQYIAWFESFTRN